MVITRHVGRQEGEPLIAARGQEDGGEDEEFGGAGGCIKQIRDAGSRPRNAQQEVKDERWRG